MVSFGKFTIISNANITTFYGRLIGFQESGILRERIQDHIRDLCTDTLILYMEACVAYLSYTHITNAMFAYSHLYFEIDMYPASIVVICVFNTLYLAYLRQ